MLLKHSAKETIEAARAQDAGKGFALIATEIRKLAIEMGSATGQIDAVLTRNRRQMAAGSDNCRPNLALRNVA